MTKFPKLRYPIHTKGLTLEDRALLLSYDMFFKIKQLFESNSAFYYPEESLKEDLEANLANLGHLIEKNICGMDLSLRFEGYDNQAEPIGVEIFPSSEQAKETLNK